MRLSYHGWAGLLSALSFALVIIGVLLGTIPSNPASTLSDGDTITITCGSPWSPSAAITSACAREFGARGDMGLVLIGLGVMLLLGVLLVGMLIAGVRDAVAGAQQQPAVTTAAPAPAPSAPTA